MCKAVIAHGARFVDLVRALGVSKISFHEALVSDRKLVEPLYEKVATAFPMALAKVDAEPAAAI